MSTPTTRTPDDTNEAPFLAPETHQKAGSLTPKEKHMQAEVEQLATSELISIPLSLLVPSPFNARKNDSSDVNELAALIKSQGLMQNLVVIPHDTKRGKPTDKYGVVAGGRRLRALKQLAKAGDVAPDVEVLCKLITREDAIAASIAENSARVPMTVADTVSAFSEMIAAGAGVEDVAVCFGITPLTVQRRLKLAHVSPKLFALFRDEQINLDQLMALAISDDHAAQERVWESTSSYNRHPSTLRRLLLGQEIDVARDRIAKFVGLAAYEAAGGAVVRDLFGEEASGYLVDAELLQRLATEKLTAEGERIKAEGWGWIETRLSFDHSERRRFLEAPMSRREPTREEQQKLSELTAEKAAAEQALEALYANDDCSEEEAEALETRAASAESAIEQLQWDLRHWSPEVMAHAGAVIAIDHAGRLDVTRGLVKPEDRKVALKDVVAVNGEDGDEEAKGLAAGSKPTHSEALMRKLTAHRTKALQVMLADNTHVALAALAHRLLRELLLDGFYGDRDSALRVRADPCDGALTAAADDMEASRAWSVMRARVEAWGEQMPGDAAQLLQWLIAQPQDTLLELLALCTALSTDTVIGREADHPGDALAVAVGLDMADWWTPTAGSYFNHVPKARIVEDVTDATSADKAVPLAKLKKAEAVATAEAILAGSRWLPSPLRPRAV